MQRIQTAAPGSARNDISDIETAAKYLGKNRWTIDIYMKDECSTVLDQQKENFPKPMERSIFDFRIDHSRLKQCLSNKYDLSKSSNKEAAGFITEYVNKVVLYSRTYMSLNPAKFSCETFQLISELINLTRQESYRINGDDEITFKAIRAVVSQCGNCGEMSCAGVFFLRHFGFQGVVEIMSYKDHSFLQIGGEDEDSYIADSWQRTYYKATDIADNLFYYKYRGKDGEGRPKGILLPYHENKASYEKPVAIRSYHFKH